MRILFIGDIVGRDAREAVRTLTPRLKEGLAPHFVVANGENSAGGKGITGAIVAELLDCGIDLITTGNHVWDQREMLGEIDRLDRIIRPLNYPPGTPGRGVYHLDGLTVINAEGRLFMRNIDCPFRAVDSALAGVPDGNAVLLDFHAETTSEKLAMFWHVAGRVGAAVGTHTHVPTADARVLPNGTAIVTDVGMVGPIDSVIGLKPQNSVRGFITSLHQKFELATGPVQFNAVLVDLDDATRLATAIRRVDYLYHPETGDADPQ